MNCENCSAVWEDDWLNCPHCGWATPPESDAVIINWDQDDQAFMRRNMGKSNMAAHELAMRKFRQIADIVTGQTGAEKR